jgi:excisionase family DNA binding protein
MQLIQGAVVNYIEPKEFYSSEEIQHWLGLGRTKVFELLNTPISDGGIPNYRIGRRIVVRRQDVFVWLEQNRYHPGNQW